MANRPDYLALDAQGLEITRKALVIGELPHEARVAACFEAASQYDTIPRATPLPFWWTKPATIESESSQRK